MQNITLVAFEIYRAAPCQAPYMQAWDAKFGLTETISHPAKAVEIENGWEEERFTFRLIVDVQAQFNTGSSLRHYCYGYFPYVVNADALRAAIAQPESHVEMVVDTVLTYRSTVVRQSAMEETVIYHLVESIQYLADDDAAIFIFDAESKRHLIRPADIFTAGSIAYLPDFEHLIDVRAMLNTNFTALSFEDKDERAYRAKIRNTWRYVNEAESFIDNEIEKHSNAHTVSKPFSPAAQNLLLTLQASEARLPAVKLNLSQLGAGVNEGTLASVTTIDEENRLSTMLPGTPHDDSVVCRFAYRVFHFLHLLMVQNNVETLSGTYSGRQKAIFIEKATDRQHGSDIALPLEQYGFAHHLSSWFVQDETCISHRDFTVDFEMHLATDAVITFSDESDCLYYHFPLYASAHFHPTVTAEPYRNRRMYKAMLEDNTLGEKYE